MAETTVQEVIDKARAAAEAAKAAAEQAQTYADQAALVAGNALTHGEHALAASPFVYQFSIFVMAIFVGYYVVWSVTPALHTPLMSVTNAISSVIVVGALLAIGAGAMMSGSVVAMIFGFIALVLASINIFGGFLVTQRMLAMYKKKG
jgi:NAD(P) transhydrogenase subunit alpha